MLRALAENREQAMLGRDRRHERREERREARRDGPEVTRYQMRQRMISMITPVRERWSVKVEGAPDLRVQGNIVDHEYAIEREGQRVAEVSKRWFRVRDTYGVEVAPGENDILVLAAAAVIDTMAHPDR